MVIALPAVRGAGSTVQSVDSPMDILKKRYAQGEIDKDDPELADIFINLINE